MDSEMQVAYSFRAQQIVQKQLGIKVNSGAATRLTRNEIFIRYQRTQGEGTN